MRRSRKASGSAISETGPALFILLICIFFPACNILQLAAAYGISQLYHDYMIREISHTHPAQTQRAIDKINADFTNNALFGFLRLQPSNFNVSQTPRFYDANNGQINSISPAGNRNIERVSVGTTVTCTPYFTVPFFANVPGLSAPVPFTIVTTRPQEEKGLN